MKIFRIIPVMALLGGSHAAEPPVSVAPFPGSGGSAVPGTEPRLTPPKPMEGPAWLGFKVSKPDEATRAHLPDLPVGMGFVVQSVDPKGPAENSGLHPLDVVWKFGDQFLVNEGQLAVLLRTRKPGDQVSLSVFRSGQEIEVSLTLGAFPLNRPLPVGPAMEELVNPESGSLLTRIINRESRTATVTDDEGKATLQRSADGSGYELEISDSAGTVVFKDKVSAAFDVTPVPEAWRRRVWALRRGLDGALDGHMESLRSPRPRVMTPTDGAEKH